MKNLKNNANRNRVPYPDLVKTLLFASSTIIQVIKSTIKINS